MTTATNPAPSSTRSRMTIFHYLEWISIILIASLAACAQPPEAELTVAEQAVARAVEAEAETWAETELETARESLARAKRLIETREYPEAREELALATHRAEDAATAAAEAQERAQIEIEEAEVTEEATAEEETGPDAGTSDP